MSHDKFTYWEVTFKPQITVNIKTVILTFIFVKYYCVLCEDNL